jgi:subtilisin family serine protease
MSKRGISKRRTHMWITSKSLLSAALALPLALAVHAQTIVVGPDRGPDRPPDGPRSGKRLSLGGFSLDLGALGGLIALRDSAIPDALPDQLVFTTTADAGAIATTVGVDLLESASLQSLKTTLVLVRLRKGDNLHAAQARLAAQPGVQDVQQNLLSQSLGDAGASLPKRFAVHRLSDTATQHVSGTIAMIDTVVAMDHAALKGARIEQTSFIADASPAAHGTALAGLIVGTGAEVPGVARGARLVSLAAFTQRKDGVSVASTSNLAKAMDAAAILKPDVLNLSFGGKNDPLLVRLLDEINRRGVCVAAAGGNGGARATAVPFPGSHPASLAVGAVDDKLGPYAYSTRSMRIDVVAVGVDVFVPVPGAKQGGSKSGSYRRMSGSSMATAFVAGNLLRMPECSGLRDPQAMRQRLKAAAQDMGLAGPDSVFGAGLFLLPEKNISAR